MKQLISIYTGLLLAFLVIGCQSPSTHETIQNLNGYWKIYKVKKKNGKERVYKMSPLIDFIKIDSIGKGYRVKVRPQSDGSYTTSRDAEYFTIKPKNDSLRFHYKTPMDHWTETLIYAEKDEFRVKNNLGITYTYKRFKSITDELKHHAKQ